VDARLLRPNWKSGCRRTSGFLGRQRGAHLSNPELLIFLASALIQSMKTLFPENLADRIRAAKIVAVVIID
jgi:hypothetical protein